MLSLVIREGERAGTLYRLGTRVLTIGREHQNPIQVVDPEVSRRHALIRWTGSSYVLQDLKSQNGTYVGGSPVAERELSVGDLIRVGKTILEVVPDQRDRTDNVLGRKVVKDEVRATTIPSPSLEPSHEGVVDLDAEAERRAMRLVRVIATIKEAIRAGRHRTLVHKEAMSGVLALLAPDRVAVALAGVGGKVDVEASVVSPECQALAPVPPIDTAAISRAIRSGAAVLGEESAEAAEGVPAHGAVAVVPVQTDGRVVGALYVDALLRGGLWFLGQDLEVLEPIAKAIAPTFAAKPAR